MKISIITINYNNFEGLRKTIESVVDQTYSNIEYIIIDGGSNDGSKEYIESHKEYFDCWVSKKDTGIYNAMNKGISKATGDYLLFLNSGDILYSKDVVKEFEKLEEKGDVNYGNLYFDYGTRKAFWSPPAILRLSILYNGSLPHPGTFFKKEVFEMYGSYDESYQIVSDWAYFFMLFLKSNIIFKKIDLVVSVFAKDGISSSSDGLKNIEKERNRFIEENLSSGLNESVIELLKKEKELEILTKKYKRLSSNIFVQFALRINTIKARLLRSNLTSLL